MQPYSHTSLLCTHTCPYAINNKYLLYSVLLIVLSDTDDNTPVNIKVLVIEMCVNHIIGNV